MATRDASAPTRRCSTRSSRTQLLAPRLEDPRRAGSVDVGQPRDAAYFPGSSTLPEILAARGVDTLIVTGTVTNVCVEATVRDASTRGLRVILVADACAARRDRDHNATLHVVYRTYGDVRPTSEVLDLIRASARG